MNFIQISEKCYINTANIIQIKVSDNYVKVLMTNNIMYSLKLDSIEDAPYITNVLSLINEL